MTRPVNHLCEHVENIVYEVATGGEDTSWAAVRLLRATGCLNMAALTDAVEAMQTRDLLALDWRNVHSVADVPAGANAAAVADMLRDQADSVLVDSVRRMSAYATAAAS